MIRVYFDPLIAPPFNAGVFRLYLLTEGRKIATEIKRDFERSTTTWSTKPIFAKDVGFTKDTLTIDVGTDDENYRRIVEGTIGKPRIASGVSNPGSGKKALTITTYIAKTSPRKLDARPGGRGGGIILRRYALNAGKIRPRHFDRLVQELWDAKFADRLQEALNSAADKTGYAF